MSPGFAIWCLVQEESRESQRCVWATNKSSRRFVMHRISYKEQDIPLPAITIHDHGSHRPAKPAFCRYRQGKLVVII